MRTIPPFQELNPQPMRGKKDCATITGGDSGAGHVQLMAGGREAQPAVRGGPGGREGSPFHCLRLSPITDIAVIAAWLKLA